MEIFGFLFNHSSKEEFEKPEQLSIETECDTTVSDEEEMPAQELIIPEIDF